MGLLDLPVEVLIEILTQLPVFDLGTCMRANHHLLNIIHSSVFLQYRIELDKAGVLDNPRCDYSVTKRLNMLKQREFAWANFEYDFCASVNVPYHSSGIYDVTPGVYILGCSAAHDPFITAAIQSVRLPSSKQNVRAHWFEINIGRHIIDFGTAIEEHDLISFVTSTIDQDGPSSTILEIVLCNYSSGEYHTAAKCPILPVSRANIGQPPPSVSIEIVGENLALVVLYHHDIMTSGALLHFFDWKQGIRKCEPIPIQNCGLVFLTEQLILNPNVIGKCLDIYYIPKSTNISQEDVRLIRRLQLPDISPGQLITSISCRGDPNPLGHSTNRTFIPSHRPFSNNPQNAVIILTLDFQPFDQLAIKSFSMIVHRSSLVDFVSDIKSDSGRSLTRAWEDWGPGVSRWFNTDDFTNVFITSTSGQRYVQIGADSRESPSHIQILDFNPNHVKRIKSLGIPPKTGSSLVELVTDADDTTCSSEGVFIHNIRSTLPYILCTSTEVFDHDAALIDEERLLCLRSQPQSFNVETVDAYHFG